MDKTTPATLMSDLYEELELDPREPILAFIVDLETMTAMVDEPVSDAQWAEFTDWINHALGKGGDRRPMIEYMNQRYQAWKEATAT